MSLKPGRALLLILPLTLAFTACSSSQDQFAKELKAAGFTTVGEPRTDTEKKTKKVGKRTVKSSQKIIEITVRVKGCDLEFAKAADSSGYWLDELHVNGQEPDWPEYPENLRYADAVALLGSGKPKPPGFASCYRP
ncbi:hypothetical protein NLX83_36245 [Allokutzneria sp. A3M-2-11 16]|uniref:hypothetical protein n=1 Tax=Allokutzneria sp. A3M-2-11 16 TaxID=2962043 RepID=UPI0020B8D190|nr:hypothetical protein [Allokutzneria sp. A3M-2-11 16]MCP3804731.1 hypothetical protein [Allokutzneria sp. A3M-2-11 16]